MADWKETALAKQQKVLASIPEEWRVPDIKERMKNAGFVDTREYLDSILPSDETNITNMTVLELAKSISTGDLTATIVTGAFCHRAALAHQILNCCVEILFDRAFETAKNLDEEYAKTGHVVGPLHGVPISLKDQVDLPGVPSSIGYVAFASKPKEKMSLLAQTLESMGAVFFVKTTVPTAMMSAETDSNLMGYTWNARNISLSSGGSSGGEGALIGAGGSPLGFGTDIGGSIRFPSCFQGIYGFKPSVGRFSYLNVTNSYTGQELAPSVIGPLSSSLDDISFVSKLLLKSEFWKQDPKVLRIPWEEFSANRKFTFGVITDDGATRPHPPILRGLSELTEKLKAAGHEVIPIQIPSHIEMVHTLEAILGADLGKEIIDNCKLSGEPLVDCLGVFEWAKTDSMMSLDEWWTVSDKVDELRRVFLDYWNQSTPLLTKSGNAIDAMISPVSVSTSFPKGKKPAHLAGTDYTGPFNLNDCCSIVVPIGKVDKLVDFKTDIKARSSSEADAYNAYDPELYDKMPICVQVAAKKSQEEKVLKFAMAVRDALSE